MSDVPGSPGGPEIPINVVNFASLKAKWGQFRFENNLLADGKIADRCAGLIDELITLVGADKILKEFTTIAVGPTMGVLMISGTFVYSPNGSLSQNMSYLCKALRIPLPHPYREEPSPEPTPEPAHTQAPVAEQDEVTHVMRACHYPKNWTQVHEAHGVEANVTLGAWNAKFSLVALHEEGCSVQARLPRRLRPLPLQNECQLTLEIPEAPPLSLKGTIKSIADSSDYGTVLKIMFSNLTAEQRGALTAAKNILGNPPPGTQRLRRRGRLAATIAASVALVAAGAGIYLSVPPRGSQIPPDASESDFLPPLVPIAVKPTVSCGIRFAPPHYYFPKCDGVEDPNLVFVPKAQQPPKRTGNLLADIEYARGGRHCRTLDHVELVRGQTKETTAYAVQCD
jgi:hypothetical protein